MAPSPLSVYTIPPGQSFVDALVRGMTDRWHDRDDPFSLARITLLLPTRRAVRAARSAFRRWSEGTLGTPVLLPTIRTIGDVEEEDVALTPGPGSLSEAALPPAIPELRRRLLLARLIARWHDNRRTEGNAPMGAAHAAGMARDLAGFLDGVQTEEGDLSGLGGLVPEEFAAHWQHTVEFLEILTTAWPAILEEQGTMDPALRRNRLIDAVSTAWQASPPADPIIAAGSTGSIPATARLLKTVAGLPQGAVVLPGLDTGLEDEAWKGLEDSHPQAGLARLLHRLEVPHGSVPLWPGAGPEHPQAARVRLLNAALRPAQTTDQWRDLLNDNLVSVEAVRGLSRIDAPTPALEARAIAFIMRETLEEPGKTAALVTPDRDLAGRVRRELRRWKISVDDSAGLPLKDTVPARFMRLAARTAAEGFAPVSLLSLLKHPLTRIGATREDHNTRTTLLETCLLRGPRPPRSLNGLMARAQDPDRALSDGIRKSLCTFLQAIEDAFIPLTKLAEAETSPLNTWAQAHVTVAEELARPERDAGETGQERLWAGDEGNALAGFLADLVAEGSHGDPVSLTDYPPLFDALIEGTVVRPVIGRHPRLFIWGPMEARLQQADVMILGGLNEGTWPANPGIDPWLSRPMRAELNLALPERRIGLAAHDFAQLAAGPTVFLTRSEKSGGTPQVPSRWLLRLSNLLSGAGETLPAGAAALRSSTDYVAWALALDEPDGVRRCDEPKPRPPAEARPRRLSVTQIETLIRDPYAIYARHVLELKVLDPIDRPYDQRERGTAVHDAIEAFLKTWQGPLSPQAQSALTAEGEKTFAPLRDDPVSGTFWWRRFLEAAQWFLEEERAWRNEANPAAQEIKGELMLEGGFTLSARADRIDRLKDGSYAIIDYKTGTVPTLKQVETGLSPQLPLEAIMVEAGGFEDLPPGRVGHMRYVGLSGGTEPGKVRTVPADPAHTADLIAHTKESLAGLIRQYGDSRTPYLSRPRPQFVTYQGDYDHLARVKEWSVSDAQGDGDAS